MRERVELNRDCSAVQIPAGYDVTLPKGTVAFVIQALGGTYTLDVPSFGSLHRIGAGDADAIGMTAAAPAVAEESGSKSLEEQVWEQLKTCYDPEIPVNIVDLGLVYDMKISPLADGANRVDVQMTLTAPGCGMGTYIAQDARERILQLSGVTEADVQLVWDPPWGPQRISPEGRERLGMD